MRVYLVHHAEAVAPSADPQRPLSPRGARQAAWLAGTAKDAGVKPVAIWHSGKLRARQTAEAFLRTCNAFASFQMVRGLRPEDPPLWLRDALEAEEHDVLVVGHMPHLPELAELLATTRSFPPHGMIALERIGPRQYAEQWRAEPPLDEL
jgi:phosphohistidine phosphatase